MVAHSWHSVELCVLFGDHQDDGITEKGRFTLDSPASRLQLGRGLSLQGMLPELSRELLHQRQHSAGRAVHCWPNAERITTNSASDDHVPSSPSQQR